MYMRSFTSVIVFKHPFVLRGSPDEFPAGQYELLVEEELLDGLSFPAFREAAAFLLIYGPRAGSGPREMRRTTQADVRAALENDTEMATKAGGLDVMLSVSRDIRNGTRSASQAQDGRTVEQRVEQWINTLTSPLPH